MADKDLVRYFQQMSDKDFIETFFLIVDKVDRKEVPFIFNKVQNTLYGGMTARNVILKYRKPGISIFIQALFLARCLRQMNRNCVVLSFDKDSTARMLDRTEWILKHLPSELEFTLDTDNKHEFRIKETNSKLYIGTAGSKAFGRGDDVTDLHASELGWWEDTSIMTGLLEALTDDAQVFVESTANGPTNLFAQLCRKAKAGDKGWKFHFFPWWMDDKLIAPVKTGFAHTEEEIELKSKFNLNDNQLEWRRRKINEMLEPELFPQEFPATEEEAFLLLGNCVFNKRSLKLYELQVGPPLWKGYLVESGERDPAFVQDETGSLSVWKRPQAGRQYLVVCDVSDGAPRSDPSCAQVVDRTSMEQVAVWHGLIEPYEFGHVVALLGRWFNGALMVVERNASGIATIDSLRNVEYPNMFYTQVVDYDRVEDTQRLGWSTNVLTRPLAIGAGQYAVSQMSVVLHDPDTLAEMKTFVKNTRTNKIEASQGAHDDRVMSFCIACYVLSTNPVTIAGPLRDVSYVDRLRVGQAQKGLGGFLDKGGY